MSEIDRRGRATERILGGSPGGVFVRLLVMSFVVGIILNVLDVDPTDIVRWVELQLRALTNLSFGAVEDLLRTLALGAVVVVPIWLILRVLKLVGR